VETYPATMTPSRTEDPFARSLSFIGHLHPLAGATSRGTTNSCRHGIPT
jgi:hypothetical protein